MATQHMFLTVTFSDHILTQSCQKHSTDLMRKCPVNAPPLNGHLGKLALTSLLSTTVGPKKCSPPMLGIIMHLQCYLQISIHAFTEAKRMNILALIVHRSMITFTLKSCITCKIMNKTSLHFLICQFHKRLNQSYLTISILFHDIH